MIRSPLSPASPSTLREQGAKVDRCVDEGYDPARLRPGHLVGRADHTGASQRLAPEGTWAPRSPLQVLTSERLP